MKPTLLAAALCAALLAGCNTIPPAQTVSLGTAAGTLAAALPPKVVAAIRTGCKYALPIATAARIIGTFTGVGSDIATAAGIADGVCQAVAAPGFGLLTVAPTYRGVTLDGRFVR